MDLEGQPARDACQNAEQGVLNQSVTEPTFYCRGSPLGGQRIVYPTQAGSIPVLGAKHGIQVVPDVSPIHHEVLRFHNTKKRPG